MTNSLQKLSGNEPQVYLSPQPVVDASSYVEPFEQLPQEDPFVKLLEYWNILCRHKISVILLSLVGVLAGVSYNVFQIPLYRGKASMEIRDSQDSAGFGFLDSRNVSLQTQIDVLKSTTLLKRVISKMRQEKKPEAQVPQDLLAPWRKALGIQATAGEEAWQEALTKARGTLQITSTRDSRIITVLCESTDPAAAAGFVNQLTNGYIEQRIEERWDTYQNTTKWLNQAQEELRARLEASEAELQRFAHSSGLLFTDETQNVSEEKLKQLQSALSEAQAKRIAKEAEYEASKASKPEALPEVLDSGPIRTYQVQRTELQRQLVELSSALTPEHYKVKRLQAQIDQLESVIASERSNIIKRIRNEYEAALRTENQIRAEYDRQVRLISGEAEDLIHYRILKREAETSRQLYELTLQKGKEASIASALRASDARVVDPATPSRYPYKPILAMNLFVGLLGGLLVGSAVTIMRERLHTTVHLTGSMPLLNIRELGVIPSAKILHLPYMKGMRRHIPASAAKPEALRLHGRPDGDIELMTWLHKHSVMAEAFRATTASIVFSVDTNTGSPKAIVVTSPSPGEGKTTILCNLAIALAEIDRRVLIIDGDMRMPRLHNIFKVQNSWGLSDFLCEKRPVEEYMCERLAYTTEIPGLFLLPSGASRANYSTLLHSSRMLKLLARCRSDFSIVLIDAPPVLNVPDARILGRAADFTILVFRANGTTREEAAAALRQFEDDGTPILGTVLNDFNPIHAGYGTYRSYSSYYSRYESGYGSAGNPS